MKIITKVGCVGLLGFSTLMLSACGDNPMMDPETMENVTKLISNHLSTEALVSCSEYGAYPDKFEYREPVCSKWMKAQYEEYNGRLKLETMFHAASSATDESKIPTFEQFTDSDAWEIIWNKNGKKWTEELNAEKKKELKQEQEREKERIKREQWEKEQAIKNAEWEKKEAERKRLADIEAKKTEESLCKRFPTMHFCSQTKKTN